VYFAEVVSPDAQLLTIQDSTEIIVERFLSNIMRQHKKTTALILTLTVTTGCFFGIALLLRQFWPSMSFPKVGSSGQVTVLADTFSGYSTLRTAELRDALAEEGITLKYEDEFDQTKRAERLSRGQADLLATTLDQFLQQQPEGKIVGLIDRTVGADAVVLNTKKYPKLKSLTALSQLAVQERAKGNQLAIAFAGDTPSEYLALVLDTKFSAFTLADFEQISVTDASEAWALLQDPSQNVAIAIIWEPFVTQARQQGYTVVLSSRDVPTAIVDVIVASERSIRSQPDTISTFLEAYYRRINTHAFQPAQLQTQIARDGGLSVNEAIAITQGIEFFTALETNEWLTQGILAQRIESIASVLVLSGRLNQRPENPTTLFTAEPIAQAIKNSQDQYESIKAEYPEAAERLKKLRVASRKQPGARRDRGEIGLVNVRGKVEFKQSSAELTGTGKQTLNQLAREIQEFNSASVAIRVIGHTSRTGSVSLNQKLSQQRATVVRNYLHNLGLKHTIIAEGKGFYLPLSGLSPTDPRQQRTEVRLVRFE